jgi:hypothetical protein
MAARTHSLSIASVCIDYTARATDLFVCAYDTRTNCAIGSSIGERGAAIGHPYPGKGNLSGI